jgi:hypothetical protein
MAKMIILFTCLIDIHLRIVNCTLIHLQGTQKLRHCLPLMILLITLLTPQLVVQCLLVNLSPVLQLFLQLATLQVITPTHIPTSFQRSNSHQCLPATCNWFCRHGFHLQPDKRLLLLNIYYYYSNLWLIVLFHVFVLSRIRQWFYSFENCLSQLSSKYMVLHLFI